MANSPQQQSLLIESRHVQRQFNRRGSMDDAQFLYSEVATRMLQRLKLIRLSPNIILDAGCGTGRRLTPLKERYPSSQLIALDHNSKLLSQAQSLHTPAWWQRLVPGVRPGQSIQFVLADMASTGLTAESIDLIWSNLAIHWHQAPHDVLREWSRVLRPDGLAFFSGWGPATGQEIRQALLDAGLKTATLPLVDMHDLGDIMVEQGFADPVMDQEIITLTYDDANTLLADARALGGNPNPARKASLTSRQWRARLIQSLEKTRGVDGKLRLTLEIAYGHAWRGAIRRQAQETRISLQSITHKSAH